MLTKENMVELGQKYSMNTFDRGERVMVSGQGSYLTDSDGNTYLDFISGIAVNTLGHSHPKIANALYEQSQKLMHAANTVWYEPTIKASQRLIEYSVLDKVFFSNSGAEANEGAIKLARKYGEETKDKDATEIITMKQSFHGRTMATLKATGQESFHKNFGPHLEGFKYVEFNDSQALKEAVTDQTCAVMLEVIQGEGGVNTVSDEFVETIKQLRKEKGILVILDEVQTGIGRTGNMFAYEQVNLEPDIMTLAKGIGGGFPTGAILAKDYIAEHFSVGDHGTTFGGNPMATACINTVLDVIEEEDLIKNVNKRSAELKEGIKDLMTKYDKLKSIKGSGLLIGIEYDGDVKPVIDACYENRLMITSAKGNVLRLLPPLNVSKEEIEEALTKLDQVLAD